MNDELGFSQYKQQIRGLFNFPKCALLALFFTWCSKDLWKQIHLPYLSPLCALSSPLTKFIFCLTYSPKVEIIATVFLLLIAM